MGSNFRTSQLKALQAAETTNNPAAIPYPNPRLAINTVNPEPLKKCA